MTRVALLCHEANQQEDTDVEIRYEGDPFVCTNGPFDHMLDAGRAIKEDAHAGGG